ncbi:MAG: peptide chain release factor N(5)-glutamine methyltransferase [Chloroflexi bacterium]|nr:peptide chain release factor N(5)-glutamine methyltransferase [Chloroflexota bacterium]
MARLDARLLLQHVTGWSTEQVLAHPDWSIGPADRRAFQALVARRAADEPVAYLLGEREFYGRTFRVDRRALIPRPETELLVDLGLAAIARLRVAGIAAPRVVDVGTGCGAVAVSVALDADVPVVGTDVSLAALTLAQENAGALNACARFVAADLLTGLTGPFHVVLANLPYVPHARDLPRDVRDYEPHVALFGGQRGTELIERLLHEAPPVLAPGGELCVELDEEEQAAPVASLARSVYPNADVTVCRDNGGYDRVVRVLTAPSLA